METIHVTVAFARVAARHPGTQAAAHQTGIPTHMRHFNGTGLGANDVVC